MNDRQNSRPKIWIFGKKRSVKEQLQDVEVVEKNNWMEVCVSVVGLYVPYQ